MMCVREQTQWQCDEVKKIKNSKVRVAFFLFSLLIFIFASITVKEGKCVQLKKSELFLMIRHQENISKQLNQAIYLFLANLTLFSFHIFVT